jgi:hypothetical protein
MALAALGLDHWTASYANLNRRYRMRNAAAIVALITALVPALTVTAPTASAAGQCRPGSELYDTGIAGAFKEDRNLNGLVCDRWKQTSTGFRHWYTDDR